MSQHPATGFGTHTDWWRLGSKCMYDLRDLHKELGAFYMIISGKKRDIYTQKIRYVLYGWVGDCDLNL